MAKNHPRLAFWLTASVALAASALAIYHLITVTITLTDPLYSPMLSGFTGAFFQMYDYFIICLPVCLLLLAALIMNLFWSHALNSIWNISAILAIFTFLVCGLLMLLGIHSGSLTVSLHMATRAIFQSITAVTLTFSLTDTWIRRKKE